MFPSLEVRGKDPVDNIGVGQGHNRQVCNWGSAPKLLRAVNSSSFAQAL